MELESASPEETQAIGAAIAGELEPGDVVTIAGELGSGKTTLVRGACRALGVETPVTSPTYTIGNRYPGRVPVSHLDLYRFQGFSSAEWGDLEPYFDEAVVFVEWPEVATASLPTPRLTVLIRHVSPERRLMALASPEESLLERVRRRVDPGSRHRDDDGDGSRRP